jgi:hypothetical protein
MDRKPPFYLYCFSKANALIPELESVGNTSEAFLIQQGAIAIVASSGTATRYPVSRKNLLAHQGIIEGVMKHSPVLPMRFGTVAPSLDVVMKVLSERQEELNTALDLLEGSLEYAVRIRWADEEQTLKDIGEQDPQIIAYKEQLQTRGQATYQDRIKLGQLVEQALQLRQSATAQEVQELCENYAEKVLTVSSKDLANFSLLMKEARYAAFMSALERFDEEQKGSLRIKVTGPLPPFSFSEMSLSWAEEDQPST